MSKPVYFTEDYFRALALDIPETVLNEANKYFFGTEQPEDVKKLFESKSDDIREYGKIKKVILAKDKDANPVLTEIGVLITKKYGTLLENITYSEKIGIEVDAIGFADDKASGKCYYLVVPTKDSPEERKANRKHYHYGDEHFGWLKGW